MLWRNILIYDHIAEALKEPKIVKLENNFYLARFESMKIYSTLYAVKSLLEREIINRHSILIDSSSGIYAYALALACHKYQLKCHIIASKTVESSMKTQIELLGAYVEGVPSAGSLKLDQSYRVEKVEQLLKENSNYYWMQQYHDDIHYGGYEAFANIILNDINTEKLTILGGIGSGCSTGALGIFLRQKGIKITLCGIQPFGSVTFGAQDVYDPEIIIAGIGSAIDFRNVKYENYDSIDWLSFDCCLSGTVELIKRYAIYAGLSSGGSYCVGKYLFQRNPSTPCLVIAPDTGHRYAGSVFARHHEAKPLEQFKPQIINHANELALPWSRYLWDRKEKSHLCEFTSLIHIES
ncbi:pyridoxal-phosphate dependent enzyme [Providencia sp. PROV236]|uniref:pyridoxal-phosphate dependent enzyme n=1 Tax=Providencia sp. PROV236 TaxID=2936798 RepID=UPI0034E1B405